MMPPAQLSPEDEALQACFGAPSALPEPDEQATNDDNNTNKDSGEQKALDTGDPRAVLKYYWGHNDFRGIQRDIIDSILSGKDTVGLMPTGGGKSVTFQVPALMLEGVCLVITPLIALMKDQVKRLRRLGILATCVHSGMTSEEIVRELDNVVLGNYKFLYLSPERIHSDVFQYKLQYMKVSFFAIDEAHCISQWGFDFRPSYLQICALRDLLPDAPILALTATATATVLDDIQQQLRFREKRVFRMSFERENVIYLVRKSEDKMGDLLHLLSCHEGSAIVYTRSRAGTRETALALQQAGVPALYYHAGLPTADKDARQESWERGITRVMVSTNAFGMGIDKSDVRLVVHLDLPDSLEAYFQEAGRAGRDGKEARAVLLFNDRDHRNLAQRIAQTFPKKDVIRNIYDDIAYYFQLGMGEGEGAVLEFNLDKFCQKFRYFPVTVVNAFTILERAGVLAYTGEEDSRSRLMMIARRDDLYHFRSRNPHVDPLLDAILRHYSGLFSDYVFIDEAFLANQCDISENEVYETLLGLTRARILHYIPRKAVARITYLQRRIEGNRLPLGSDVYEKRLEQYEHRINAILNYCTDNTTCRSQQLLRYFDDNSAHDCGHCDVCDEAGAPSLAPDVWRKRILDVLADDKPHSASDFRIPHSELPAAQDILMRLIETQQVVVENGAFHLGKTIADNLS